jgi:citrate synthase
MIFFWRDNPASVEELTLLSELHAAHLISSFRNNLSSVAVASSACGSGNYFQAIASGLLTLGGLHGPLIQSYDLLSGKTFEGNQPGWGNSFVKGIFDETWRQVDDLLKEHWPAIHSKIESTTNALHSNGKLVFPNPSIYTAAVGHAIGLPREVVPILFVSSRLEAWSEIFLKNKKDF